MIDGPHIGFIDFDDFCMAEPALDVGLFLAAINDTGLNALDDQQARDRYPARTAGPAGRNRRGVSGLLRSSRRWTASAWRCGRPGAARDTLHFWIKAKPAEPDNGLLMLLDTLQTIRVIRRHPAAATATVQQARRRLAIPAARYAAYASALLAGAGVSLNDLAELLGGVTADWITSCVRRLAGWLAVADCGLLGVAGCRLAGWQVAGWRVGGLAGCTTHDALRANRARFPRWIWI
ncbi:MAG: hypothetical protein U0Z44_15680 [Kouleothrix sp.]